MSSKSYYESQLNQVLSNTNANDIVGCEFFPPLIKIISNGNGKDTNNISLNEVSAKEIIFWLAKNFVNDFEMNSEGITIKF